jgi:L-lactate dehydrogenase complex protein LldE
VIPCYLDVFYPEVGIATFELLERLNVEVDQTCCGQPVANSGCESDSRATQEHFIRLFSRFAYIVIPSGSCTHHVRNKFVAAPPSPERQQVSKHVCDLVEFIHDVLKVKEFPGPNFLTKLPCTTVALRFGLNMASMSERMHDPIRMLSDRTPTGLGFPQENS